MTRRTFGCLLALLALLVQASVVARHVPPNFAQALNGATLAQSATQANLAAATEGASSVAPSDWIICFSSASGSGSDQGRHRPGTAKFKCAICGNLSVAWVLAASPGIGVQPSLVGAPQPPLASAPLTSATRLQPHNRGPPLALA